MSRITKIVALCGVVFVAGCSLIKDDAAPVTKLADTPKDSVLAVTKEVGKGSGTLKNVEDSLVVPIQATAGKPYSINLAETSTRSLPDFEIEYTVYDPSGKEVAVDGDIFIAKVTGVYKIVFTVLDAGTSLSFPFTYAFEEIKSSTDLGISGKWLLVSSTAAVYGQTQTHTYTETNANELLELKGDSVYATYYSWDSNKVVTNVELYASSTTLDQKPTISGDMLTLTIANAIGSSTFVYKKYTGNSANIQWEALKPYVVPANLLGNWYLTSEMTKYHYKDDTTLQDEDTTTSYKSVAETSTILKIASDSVTYYHSYMGEFMDSVTYSIADEEYMLKMMSVSGSTATNKDIWFYVDASMEAYGAFVSTYTKYAGAVPPEEWLTTSDSSVYDTTIYDTTIHDTTIYDTTIYDTTVYDTTISDSIDLSELNYNGGLSGNWKYPDQDIISFSGNKMSWYFYDYMFDSTTNEYDSSLVIETFTYGVNKAKTILFIKDTSGYTDAVVITSSSTMFSFEGWEYDKYTGSLPTVTRAISPLPTWNMGNQDAITIPLRAKKGASVMKRNYSDTTDSRTVTVREIKKVGINNPAHFRMDRRQFSH